MSAVEKALKLPQDDAVRVPAARIFIAAGRHREGAELAATLGEQLQATAAPTPRCSKVKLR